MSQSYSENGTPLLSPQEIADDPANRLAEVRPQRLQDFVGQPLLKRNLEVFLKAAHARTQPIDHILLCGPPGLGKTTLARIVATEMDATFRATSGPVITKPGELAAILTGCERGDVLFIDEIHRLSSAVEEVLYSAMEERNLDLMIGSGAGARSVRLTLSPFTLIGATTRAGLMTRPLRERFGIPLELTFYSPDELSEILLRTARRVSLPLEQSGADTIAGRSRATPRIALRLLRRISDFAIVENRLCIDSPCAQTALESLGVDESGANDLDRRYLHLLAGHFAGGPAGLETLAASLSQERDVLEDVVEPFLLQQGWLLKTARGRVLSESGWQKSGFENKALHAKTLFQEEDDSQT